MGAENDRRCAMKALVCICGSRVFNQVFEYRQPPEGEVRFDFGAVEYRREIWRCSSCGHFLSVHDLDMSALYRGQYVDSTYGESGLRRAFERINSLDPSRSDNTGRVDRVRQFVTGHFGERIARGFTPEILDVGSGLCVFLYRLHGLTGWPCTALDPDPRAAEHATRAANVKAICADFMHADGLGKFDVIAFNKVIEHVVDPVAMLRRSIACLRPDGIVYLELPDGEAAMSEGFGREEFFIDHRHIFSPRSCAALAQKAGFAVHAVERLREPSSKFTLRCFLAPHTDPNDIRA